MSEPKITIEKAPDDLPGFYLLQYGNLLAKVPDITEVNANKLCDSINQYLDMHLASPNWSFNLMNDCDEPSLGIILDIFDGDEDHRCGTQFWFYDYTS